MHCFLSLEACRRGWSTSPCFCPPAGTYRQRRAGSSGFQSSTCSGLPGATPQPGRWTFSSFTTGLPSIRLVFWSTWRLEQLTSLGGGPAQALQQACFPSGLLVLQLACQRCCNMFCSTWSNSPAWEVDLLKLYIRLAFHQVSVAACMPEMLQHVLVHLEQFASLGGGPTQALQQACLPSG